MPLCYILNAIIPKKSMKRTAQIAGNFTDSNDSIEYEVMEPMEESSQNSSVVAKESGLIILPPSP